MTTREVTFRNVEPAAARTCGEFVRLRVKTMNADRGVSDRGTASDYFVNYPLVKGCVTSRDPESLACDLKLPQRPVGVIPQARICVTDSLSN